MEFLGISFGTHQLGALLQVVLIDLVMSGDNAIIIGMAVAGLPPENRTKIIFWGVAGATVLRIAFAAVTTELLQIIGLTLAGGLLLLWVAYRMYRELRLKSKHAASEVSHAETAPPKTMRQAMIQPAPTAARRATEACAVTICAAWTPSGQPARNPTAF